MSANDGGPAFPQPIASYRDGMYTSAEKDPENAGMTLRAWFAGQALAGWLASYGPEHEHPATTGGARIVAKWSYEMADAMLAEQAGAE